MDKRKGPGFNDRKRDFNRQRRTEEIDECVVFGRNAVKELLASGRDIEKVYIQSGEREGSVNVLIGIASERKIPIVEVDKLKLDNLTAGAHHQGIVAMASERNYATVEDILAYAREKGEPPFIIILDGVEDPHNLGAIIRTAEASGVHGIIIPKRRSASLNATVAKSASGALEYMKVARVTNIASEIEKLKKHGIWVFGADMDGKPYTNFDYDIPLALVIGNEGKGIGKLISSKCDEIISLPMNGKINSLNASVAAGILMYEVVRKRG